MSQARRPTGTEALAYNPVNELNRLSQQMTQLFDEPWPAVPALFGKDGYVPQVDVEESDDAYTIELDLPGVDKDDIDIEVAGRRLVVSGERKEKERVGVLRRQTRTVGRFRFEVALPDQVEGDGIDASMRDGVLRLRVPKKTGEQRRRIEVK
jgi:HSP20 family protein